MALIFCDGFDHYQSSDVGLKWNNVWTNGFSPIIHATGGRSNNAGYADFTRCMVSKFFTAGNNFIIGVAVNFPAGNNGMIAQFGDSVSGKWTATLTWKSDNTIQIKNAESGTVIGTTAAAYTPGNWYYLEWKVQLGSSCSAHANALRVNNAVVIDGASGVNTLASGMTNANQLQTGSNSGVVNQYTIFMDDFVLLDNSGSTNNDFIGDVIVEAIYPTAQGNYNNFTVVGAGSNHAAVATHPPDATKYITGQSLGIHDSYTFNTLTQSVQDIIGVQLLAEAKKTGTGTRAIAPFFRQSSTNYDGTPSNLGSSYGYIQNIADVNPATSASFTSSEVTSLEAGVKITT